MKKQLKTIALATVFGLFAFASAKAADGDIYDIVPCDELGLDLSPVGSTWSTFDAPLGSGETVYFKVRLVARDVSATPAKCWYLDYDGIISEEVAKYLYPMRIGIYVSGRRTYASLVTARSEGNFTTELVFKYTTQPGDFAMPIRLATSDGPAGDSTSNGEYVFDPLSSYWKMSRLDAGDNVVSDCSWVFTSINERLARARTDIGRAPVSDYSLEKCGFFVKTVDFDSNWEVPAGSADEAWRTIHDGSTATGSAVTPRLVISAPSEQSRTFYVWSDDETKVRIKATAAVPVTTVTMMVGGTPKDFTVGKVTFEGGQSAPAPFLVEALAGSEGGSANLILSAYSNFTYSASTPGMLLVDYITVPVRCIQPLPASIVAECGDTTIIADSDYLTSKTTLSIFLSQPGATDVHVTLKTTFEDTTATGSWGDYVRFSQSEVTVQTLPDPSEITFTIPAGSTEPKTIYVYALRGDAHTTGTGHQIKFTPYVSDAEKTAAGIVGETAAGVWISAAKPVITTPDATSVYEVTSGEELEINVAVEDTYADMTDTAVGYQVRVKTGSTASWQTLTERFKASGEGGELVGLTSGNPPTVKYSAAGPQTSQIQVISPISGKKSDIVPFTVNVTPAKTTSAICLDADPDHYIEGDAVHFRIALSAQNDTEEPIYAFLLCNGDMDASMFGGTGAKAILTDATAAAPGSVGLTISEVGSFVNGSFTVLDGLSADDAGQNYTFSVVLSKTKEYTGTRMPGYATTEMLNITVYNREPTFKTVYLNGFDAESDGYTFSNQYPKGQDQTIQPEFDDVSYDLKHGFTYKWTAYRDGQAVANGTVAHDTTKTATETTTTTNASKTVFSTVVPDGANINECPIVYNFPRAGTWMIKVQMKDKDMTSYSASTYSISFVVLANPQITITPLDSYDETDGKAQFDVGLGYFDSDEDIVVKLTVTPPAGTNPGALALDPALKAVPAGYPALAANEYYMTFDSAQTIPVKIDSMDGTARSASKGFTVKAEVVNDGLSPEGTTWAEYYTPHETKIYINNVAPEFGYVTPANTNAWEVSGGAATSYPIAWSIRSDVDYDFTTPWANGEGPGIKVTFQGCDNATSFYVKDTDEWSGTFIPNFGSMQGDQNVVLTIEDKDQGLETWVYMYKVKPSRFLVTIQNGPSGSADSELSRKYIKMDIRGGRGQGHVYAQGATFSDGELWQQRWNCSSATEIPVYAWGYRTGAYDNGWLDNGRDIALTPSPNGSGTTKAASADVTAGYYAYPDAVKDSFLYAWLISAPQSESAPPEWKISIMPEQPGAEPIPGKAILPTSTTEDGSYIPVYAEAVFSKEWYPEDNLGDINQDGVPDYFAHAGWGDGGSSLITSSVGGEATDSDLVDIASYNPDGDFIPGVWQAQGALSIVNRALASYAPIGYAFNNRLEFRGFHYGLNETSITKSVVCFSEAETNAYKAAFAEKNGRDWEDTDGFDLGFWSPEPRGPASSSRMDPTMSDTDSDGMPDGWEYFFWYQAKVWAPGGADLGKPRNGQTYVFERFNPPDILEGVEILAGDVLERFNPCEPLNTEVNGFSPDFDGDGLTDMEEMLIGTNPCHWDTDGDHMCDAWEVMNSLDPLNGKKDGNPDGDFMAYASLSSYWSVEIEPGVYLFDVKPFLTRYDPLTDEGDYEMQPVGDPLYADKKTYDESAGRIITTTTDAKNADGEDNYPLFMVETALGGVYYTVDDSEPGAVPALESLPVLIHDVVVEGALIASARLDGAGDPYLYGRKGDGGKWDVPMLDYLQPESEYPLAMDTILKHNAYILVHDQVKTAFGFDPRTAWHATDHGYVSDRWDPLRNTTLSIFDVTGAAVDTAPYTDYDEYLVMRYRMDYGVVAPKWNDKDMWANIGAYTTMPSINYAKTDIDALLNTTNAAGVAEITQQEADALTVTANISEYLAQAFAEAHSDKAVRMGHGADTDGDGVPDGWELYMTRNPNAGPGLEEDGLGPRGAHDMDYDGLAYSAEYAGTDACNAYANCPSIYGNHPGNSSGWFNKFFPTDPDDYDTDGDHICDGSEGAGWNGLFPNGGNVYQIGGRRPGFSFVYGAPKDGPTLTCIRGGGMNPCTVDTDKDAIPDLWEMQHAGVPVNAATREYVGPAAGEVDVEIAEVTFTADGLNAAGFTAPDAVYICGGMDATWQRDACSSGDGATRWVALDGLTEDPLLGTARDMDFDHDGLQNYQEYLVQTLRHLRWDDTTTPLMGRMLDGSTPGFVRMMQNADQFAAACIDAGYPESATNDFNAAKWIELGYFGLPAHSWDMMVACAVFPDPEVMLPPVGTVASSAPDLSAGYTLFGSYISTDPRVSDTDMDGMDDFYELFHGLNPLLGTTTPRPMTPQMDMIWLAYGASPFTPCAFDNSWLSLPLGATKAAADPILYPWVMGASEVDPDGDGLRNDQERVTANLTSPMTSHTDPTPLWFTDSSSPNSYVAQYYVMTAPVVNLAPFLPPALPTADPYSQAAPLGTPGGFMYSFEENEGYDTDNDWTADGREMVRTFRAPTDPLDFDDQFRRQALYLDGNQSWAQTIAANMRGIDGVDFFKQFTVEAWVRPEKVGEQTILERSSLYGYDANNKDDAAIRANFRIGMTEAGNVYGMFDNDDAIESGRREGVSCQTLVGPVLPLNEWSHVALTYDGKELVLYVDGKAQNRVATSLIPANGVTMIMQDPASTNFFDGAYSAMPGAFFIGGRPETAANGGDQMFSTLTADYAFMNATEWFQGYVDEIRIWDGARTSSEIADNWRRRMTKEDAAANRLEVYTHVLGPDADSSRNDNDNLKDLTAELVQLYDFSTLPGAAASANVAKTPAGFETAVAGQLVSAAAVPGFTQNVGWWDACLTKSTVYDDYTVIPWVENTVHHLPLLDGSVVDSFLYNHEVGGLYQPASAIDLAQFVFANTAMPYASYVYGLDRYWRLAARTQLLNTDPGNAAYIDLLARSDWDVRAEFVGTADLVPMGGAFAKTCPEMWDGNGVADAWEQTGTDTDGDGLPDWWEDKYGLDPASNYDWNAIVGWNGVNLPAYIAYATDIAFGMQPDGTIVAEYASKADVDGDGLPDWWEAVFGVSAYGSDDDPDNDGLSNYAEYLVSFGAEPYGLERGWPLLKPDSAYSTGASVIDYFLTVPATAVNPDAHILTGEYIGEVVADHDFMEDWWEDGYSSSFVSRFTWDALSDRDRDGWSNFAEARAGTDPTATSSLTIGETEIAAYPIPVVEADVTLDTGAAVNGTVVFQAWSSSSLQGAPDATWHIAAGSGQIEQYSHIVGMNPGTEISLQLGPGSVVPDTISVQFCDPASMHEQYNVASNGVRTLVMTLNNGTGPWAGQVKDITRPDDTSTGDIVWGESLVIGSINYATGELTLDLAKVKGFKWRTWYADTDCVVTDIDRSYVKVNWSSKLLSASPVTRLYLGEASDGHLKEGRNTFLAYLDSDGNGTLSAGEAIAVIRDVDVGWSRVPRLTFSLSTNSPEGPAMMHFSSGSPELVRVIRKSINGNETAPRAVFSRRIDFTGRGYLTYADYVRAGTFDLDWLHLAEDAKKAGIDPDGIATAEYAVRFGDSNMDYATFTKEFPLSRTAPVLVSPSASSAPILRTARPTFVWRGGDGYTAFALEIATSPSSEDVIWSSGTNALPAVSEAGHTWSPAVYVGRELADGKSYFWRVAQFNAKYSTLAPIGETDVVWSDWAEFRTEIESTGVDATCGRLEVDVRYYGPEDDVSASSVCVEVYETPDFTGVPSASVWLRDVPLSDLALKPANGFTTVQDDNLVSIAGIPVGTWYVRAFVDRNGNGRRDPYEAWGYANGVGHARAAMYAPAPVIVSARSNPAACVVVMEDTDINQNMVPDCLDDIETLETALAAQAEESSGSIDADRDGLSGLEEDDYGSDPYVWDTDGDGLPDGYEVWADFDPVSTYDSGKTRTYVDASGEAYTYVDSVSAAEFAADGDVMAYAVTNFTVITVWDGVNPLSATNKYVVMDSSTKISVGDDASAIAGLRVVYDYGGTNGLGRAALAAGRVYEIEEEAPVALVHAQVYEFFGFDPTTANPAAVEKDETDEDEIVYGANTKPFTGLDKYLVVRYLEALGFVDSAMGADDTLEDWVNRNRRWGDWTLKPGEADSDRDGVPDGWELYTMFGPGGSESVAAIADAAISPWNYDDARDNAPAAGSQLTLLQEFDNGKTPSDPWQTTTAELGLGGLTDYEAFLFHLKTGESQLVDEDNDGLSNWAEYLASRLTGFDFDVADPFSVEPNRLDYFVQFDQDGVTKYVGECIDADGLGLIADHDFMEDLWEDVFADTTKGRYVYDAHEDPDGDGWSNWSEQRALTVPSRSASLSLVRADGSEDHTLEGYPIPTIRAKIADASGDKIDSQIVIKAWQGAYASGEADATWTVSGSGEQSTEHTRFLGLAPNRLVKFNIGPGDIGQHHVMIEFYDPNYYIETINYETNGTVKNIVYTKHNIDTSAWGIFNYKDDPSDTSNGMNTGAVPAGWVNYVNGDIQIDFSEETYRDTDATYVLVAGEQQRVIYHYDLTRAFWRVRWMGRLVEDGAVKAFSLSKADSGHLREGVNTFIAFVDADGDGAYTPGELMGIARNVNIGFDTIPELAINLQREPADGMRFLVPAQTDGAGLVRVVRTAINGVGTEPRAVYSRRVDLSEGRAFTEADLVKNGEYDFDWRRLVPDAAAFAGISAEDIRTVDYAVYVGNNPTNALTTFTRSFSDTAVAPVPIAPSADHNAVVACARPSFSWKATEGYSAFALQIAKDEGFSDIVYATTNFMPAATADGCEFSPECWVGDALEDKTTYYWRVAQMNAKFTTGKWSEPAAFTTAVDSTNADTGYGKLTAEVRYFGPADATLDDVVVGVYESADFASAPVARRRLGGADAVSTLVGDAAKPFFDVTANVTFDGIAPGHYYVMAFIDSNANGVRDPYETWGYACRIGADTVDRWSPVSFSVSTTKTDAPAALVVMEDTDVNQNWTPDCLEDMTGWNPSVDGSGDSDRDGLTDLEEDDYGTDPNVWDTDGDGMPDGWEVKFANIDPLFDDADDAAPGDVMAYAVTNLAVITVWDGVDPLSATNKYVVMGEFLDDLNMARVNVGDDASALTDLFATYDYGGTYGLGLPATAADLAGMKVYAVEEDAKVALVHDQVYEFFGFDPTTAIPPYVSEDGSNTVYGVNTKPFTALDKYLLVRYLAALGLCDEDDVNFNRRWAEFSLKPFDADNDRDGAADGWELYIGADPWNYDDRLADGDGDGLPMYREYDTGLEPSDPNDDMSIYRRLFEKGYLLVGTPEFTDGDVRRFRIRESEYGSDDDNDLITNLEEMQAYYYDLAALADIDPEKAWSDGATPDYFRSIADFGYLGLLFNGGEFIEPEWRRTFELDNSYMAGTRNYKTSGWDAWSVVRNSDSAFSRGVKDSDLAFVLEYLDAVVPGECTAKTLPELREFVHQQWAGVERTAWSYDWDYDTYSYSYTYDAETGSYRYNRDDDDDDSSTDTRMTLVGDKLVTLDEMIMFFGGRKAMSKTIEANKEEATEDDIIMPEPVMNLTLKYAGDSKAVVLVEAWQVDPSYPENGEQRTAFWNVAGDFSSGVDVVQLATPNAGSLKQGPARFVAYIDVGGDGKLSAGDTYGSTTCEVGYLGCDIVIRLCDANDALPIISLVDTMAEAGADGAAAAAERPVQTVAIVRTKVNGEYVEPRGVALRRYLNNVNRTALYPTDFVADDFIGVDRYLAKDSVEGLDPDPANLENVEEVTYEIVKVALDPEYGFVIGKTNLNHYVYVPEGTDEGGDETGGDGYTVDQQVNEEFTVRYSVTRDVPLEVRGEASSKESDALVSFLVPADRAVTKFWLDVDDKVFGGSSDRGFPLANLVTKEVLNSSSGALGTYASRRVILDKDWFRENGVDFSVGEHKVRVALGNDKFPTVPEEDGEWSAEAVFGVAEDDVFEGKIDVVVNHPTAALDEKLTIAAYEKADLANPVVVTNGCPSGEVVEIGGLRPGVDYYIAAWYVKDEEDGRGTADRRMPYDTWGYICNLSVTNAEQFAHSMAFDPVSVAASDLPRAGVTTNMVWLQDTDWNDNGIVDRQETIKSLLGVIESQPPAWEEFDIDDDGIPDDDDDDPVFDNSGDTLDGDVMAYAAVKMLVVKIGTSDAATNWVSYVVRDPVNEISAVRNTGDSVVIPRGTAAGDIQSLYTTYVYGRRKTSPLGLGVPVDLAEGMVYACEWRDVVLVHHQVYNEFGFNPNTANGFIPKADWVNSKPFTPLDKYIVTNYLAAVGAVVSPESWTNWTLNAKRVDFEYDGIPDGWELYTMFGHDSVKPLEKTASLSVINAWVHDDRLMDVDGDRLANVHEYDGGNWPTDPWDIDTDDDRVFDVYAWLYHLKGDQAGLDYDDDGLSNYAEYLISEVFQIASLNPDRAMSMYDPETMSGQSTLDYYLKFGELYLGEIFTDHDRIDDDWEAEYEKGDIYGMDYAARGIYDPDLDLDNDGWTNYAEFRAGTSPARQTDTGIDDYTLIEHPVPVVEMEVVYNGSTDVEGRTLKVSAWNEQRKPDALSAPDAEWTITTLNENNTAALQNATTGEQINEKYIGRMPKGTKTYYLGSGSVKEGSFKLLLKDKNFVEGVIANIGGQNAFVPTAYGDTDGALWFCNIIDQGGKLVTRGGIFADGHEVGTIDYDSGRVTINFDDEEFTGELMVGNPAYADSGSGQNQGQNDQATYHGLNPPNSYVKVTWASVVNVPVRGRHFFSDPASGFLRQGLTTFVVEAESSAVASGGQNADGATSKSRLYGVVRHVDVGWASAKFTVELTDSNPITPRIDLATGEFDRMDSVFCDDSRVETGIINVESNMVTAATGIGPGPTRVRVVRYAINGYPIVPTWGKGLADVVYDKTWPIVPDPRLFSELDFLLDGKFDIDWDSEPTDTFNAKVASTAGITRGADGAAGNIAGVIGSGTSITNISYMVVIGNGPATWERDNDTNSVHALAAADGVAEYNLNRIVRRFDYTRARPVAVSVEGIQYSARPTFTWRMEGEEDIVKRFGSSYTAFKLQVRKGSTVIYESPMLRAPATDANGNFRWTAPICAGNMYEIGQLFDTTDSYNWQVSMYNAKFRTDSWSAPNGASVFSTAVNAQQELNDHGYSSIAVAVKYAGPSIVLSKSANMSEKKGKVIVQAFASPDFSGDPLAQCMASSEVDELAIATENASLKGLAAIGTYYVRAFIDMDGDGKLSEWEPWGYAADAVTLVNDGTMAKAPLVGVWIEDSDSDGDWVPDAYEYAASGWNTAWENLKGNKRNTGNKATNVLPDGGIVLKVPVDELTSAGISKGLPGASLTAMQSAEFASALLGLDLSNKTTLEAIAEATRGKLVPNSVKVVAIALEQDGSAVNITVNADVASGIAGTVVSQYYSFAGSDEVKVLVKVWKKDSLEDADWEVVYTSPEPVTITPQADETIVVPFDDQLDLSSGFFKVELVEVVP